MGRWVVPRRLELATAWCEVTLDFTQAVITQDTLRIDMNTAGKRLTLITIPGIMVDSGALSLAHSKIKIRQTPDHGATITLRVELVGTTMRGRVVVRPPRRTFGQWLLRRPTSLSVGD